MHKNNLIGFADSVTSCKFSYDGSRLCTASIDGTLKLWKTSSPFELLGTLDGPQDEIHFIQWHNKGNVLLCGSEDGTMWMYDGNKCQNMNMFSGHRLGIRAGGFTPDGSLIYSASLDGTMRMWHPKQPGGDSELITSTFKQEEIGGYTCACCHPTKPLLLAGTDNATLVLALYASRKVTVNK